MTKRYRQELVLNIKMEITMKVLIEKFTPAEIEKKSMEIISNELDKLNITLDKEQAPIIKRVIHTSADFDYANNMYFSDNVIQKATTLLKNGTCIVTDTKMAQSGINKKAAEKLGIKIYNFMSDNDIADYAANNNTTRSAACMDKAASLKEPLIFAIGNAPTALIRLYELYKENIFKPELIIGVPVGFVNVVQSKELIMQTDIPCIISKGRKGGSNIAAAICNALIYQIVL